MCVFLPVFFSCVCTKSEANLLPPARMHRSCQHPREGATSCFAPTLRKLLPPPSRPTSPPDQPRPPRCDEVVHRNTPTTASPLTGHALGACLDLHELVQKLLRDEHRRHALESLSITSWRRSLNVCKSAFGLPRLHAHVRRERRGVDANGICECTPARDHRSPQTPPSHPSHIRPQV